MQCFGGFAEGDFGRGAADARQGKRAGGERGAGEEIAAGEVVHW